MHAVALSAHACAKINLTLEVRGRRGDGYHELRSLVIGVDLRDRVCCRAESQPSVTLSCSNPTLENADNLTVRAAESLARRLGRDPSIHIALEKSIPVASGLGGGSSDAATTLRLCNDLWQAGLEPSELATVGANLGSDIPLFFSLPGAVITGRGEEVEPVRLGWSGWVLLVFVDVAVSTAEVYRVWRSSDVAGRPRGTDGAIVRARTAEEISGLLVNDLEPAVFRVSPAVARAAEALDRAHIGPVRVTGAGSTLYRLFDEKEGARQAAADIERLQLDVTTKVVAAPVGPSPIVSEEY